MPNKRWKDQERRVAKIIQKHDETARRAWLSRTVEGPIDIITSLPISIDCKSTVNRESIRIHLSDLKKIRENDDNLGMIVASIKYGRPIAVLDFEDFLEELYGGKDQEK